MRSSGDGDATRVLYLVGFGRSGSTILGNVLGQTEGWFHGGEIRNLWSDGWIANRLCGCGRHFHDCPVWVAVVHGLTESNPGLDPAEIVEARDASARTRQLPNWLLPPLRSRIVRQAGELRDILADTYARIAAVTGAAVVVDSTMSPAYGMLLQSVPGIQLSVLHLIRDPRAVAYSWQKEILQEAEDGVSMRRYSVGASTAKWVIENLASERLMPTNGGMRHSVTYEDFTRDPESVVARIVERFDPEAMPPTWSGESLEIKPSHSVWGNPSRFASGLVAIRSDDRWKRELLAKHRRLVDAMTWGTRQRFGYR